MPTKTTAKKPNSKSGLKRRFDLTNRKVQFFVVIAIVAVLGGGYLTVRSFAATSSATWLPGQGINCVDNTTCKIENGSFIISETGGQFSAIRTSSTISLDPGKYDICGSIAYTGSMRGSLESGSGFLTGTLSSFELDWVASPTQRCSTVTVLKSGSYKVRLDAKSNSARGAVLISRVQIQKQTSQPSTGTGTSKNSAPAPAPAPAPSK